MKDEIVMKSPIVKITKIIRKTKAKMFTDLKIGSNIRFSLGVHRLGSNRGSSYSDYITVTNLDNGEKVCKSQNELGNILLCFEVEV